MTLGAGGSLILTSVAFYIPKESVLDDGRVRGRSTVDKGETLVVYPSSAVFDDQDIRLTLSLQEPF